jgi:hypothetical protein
MGDAQGFFAVGGGADLITGSGQGAFIGHPEKLAVVDQEHFGVRRHAQPSGRFIGWASGKLKRENWVVPPGLRLFFPLFPALNTLRKK